MGDWNVPAVHLPGRNQILPGKFKPLFLRKSWMSGLVCNKKHLSHSWFLFQKKTWLWWVNLQNHNVKESPWWTVWFSYQFPCITLLGPNFFLLYLFFKQKHLILGPDLLSPAWTNPWKSIPAAKLQKCHVGHGMSKRWAFLLDTWNVKKGASVWSPCLKTWVCMKSY